MTAAFSLSLALNTLSFLANLGSLMGPRRDPAGSLFHAFLVLLAVAGMVVSVAFLVP